jgi:hypothetical protein
MFAQCIYSAFNKSEYAETFAEVFESTIAYWVMSYIFETYFIVSNGYNSHRVSLVLLVRSVILLKDVYRLGFLADSSMNVHNVVWLDKCKGAVPIYGTRPKRDNVQELPGLCSN